MMQPLFRDPQLQQEFDEIGYVKIHAFGAELVREIKDYYRRLPLVDTLKAGYKVALYSEDLELKRQCREFLHAKISPFLEPFFVDRWPYVCSYLVKEPRGTIIPAHQDWSYCDETKHDPVTCWMPMDDVDENNGALGFINGSHKYFDYLRAFPYMVAPTPVFVHNQKILPYINILRMKAGEVVVFNDKTIHGSFSNYTNEERIAVAFILQPAKEPLFSYYLKPNGKGDTLLRYQATPDFYLQHTNPILWQLYQEGKSIAGYQADELPYRLERMEWDALEAKMLATGNHREAWKVTKTEEFFRKKLYA